MTKDEFDKLDEKEKHYNATKALAWFSVTTDLNPMFSYMTQGAEEEIEIIKIIVGKYMNGELKEVKDEAK